MAAATYILCALGCARRLYLRVKLKHARMQLRANVQVDMELRRIADAELNRDARQGSKRNLNMSEALLGETSPAHQSTNYPQREYSPERQHSPRSPTVVYQEHQQRSPGSQAYRSPASQAYRSPASQTYRTHPSQSKYSGPHAPNYSSDMSRVSAPKGYNALAAYNQLAAQHSPMNMSRQQAMRTYQQEMTPNRQRLRQVCRLCKHAVCILRSCNAPMPALCDCPPHHTAHAWIEFVRLQQSLKPPCRFALLLRPLPGARI